ncbi:hypothetical protein FGADI_12099 [Fusarium gaditjirri]|uniref:DUF7587 domain-containing protein n=1 Tax=Fusarium gaditjirri TaxID=282569 RepID=A0A8H4STI1_9HYPO|nr:hypothetical protein FGADI_12099 [Fusarium gaditjirri]
MSDDKNTPMAEVEKIASKFDTLNITEQRGESQYRKPLEGALLAFDEAAAELLDCGTNIVKLLPFQDGVKKKDFESLYLIQTSAFELGKVGRLLSNAGIRAIVSLVTLLGDKTFFRVEDLLEYFKIPIEKIAQRIMREASSQDILWKVAEECYHQAASTTGELSPVDYLATSKWVDKEAKKEDWIKFWTRSVCKCPGGPTLFQPPDNSAINHSVKRPPKHMPRYLFRVWDDNSKGYNSEDVIASVLSQNAEASHNKIDIFSMDHQEASEMLHHHLDKGLSNTLQTNNIVSWSSSLIFVIQYANWRFCQRWLGQPGEIYVCTVDTSKFSRGQFARDKWLLNWFSNARLSDEESNFHNFRIKTTEYDNGEYLSQGKLHIEGRSCTMSLRDLKNAGLWYLYPEFNINDAKPADPVKNEWTNYVKYLRQEWLVTQKTTKAKVQCALNIAEKCFPGFDQDDMALLLLSFCERKLQREKPSFQNPFLPLVAVEDINYKEPAEVDRYSTLKKRLSELSESSGEHGMKLFEQLYVLEDVEED